MKLQFETSLGYELGVVSAVTLLGLKYCFNKLRRRYEKKFD